MKYTQLIFISILIMGLGLQSCKESSLEGYHNDSYIYFDKSIKDSTTFSFAYDKNLKEGVVQLKLNMISQIENHDRTFTVRFLPEESTAKQGRDLLWDTDSYTVKANDSIAFIDIHVLRDASLSGKTVKAIFQIESSADFMPGIENHTQAQVIISDKLTRPTWWDSWHESSGLGTYSDKKYQLFIEVTGKHDLSLTEDGGTVDFSDMYGYVVMFKYWLLEHPQKEEDGSDMTVPIIG